MNKLLVFLILLQLLESCQASYRQVKKPHEIKACRVSAVISAEQKQVNTQAEQEKIVDWTNCFTWQDVIMYAALLEHESINCRTEAEQAAPIWLAENRVMSTDPQFPDTTYEVLTQPNQFLTYYKTDVAQSTVDIVEKHLSLIAQERVFGCYPIEGRPIPREYLWYGGDKVRTNYYRTTYENLGYYWDWSWS